MLTLCNREGTTVPKFVQLCVKEVEKRGTWLLEKKVSRYSIVIINISP